MTKHTLLRILCGLTFLIFLCPFFQMCSDETLKEGFGKVKKEETPYEIITIKRNDTLRNRNGIKIIEKTDTIYKETSQKLKTPEEERIEKESELIQKRKDNTYSGYELCILPFRNGINDIPYPFLIHTITLLFSIIIVIISFKPKKQTIYILGIFNLLLSIGFLVYAYFGDLLEEISQIKYGYYLFIINTIAIIIISKKLKKPSKV